MALRALALRKAAAASSAARGVRLAAARPAAAPQQQRLGGQQQQQLQQQRRGAATMSAAAKQIISTEEAPAALGPYSQAVRAGNTLYVSGQIGLVPGTKDFASDGVEGQAEQVMLNMGAILKAAGGGYASVVKTTILLADMGDFAAVNAIYGRFFPEDPPARATFAVKTLPLNAKVEIEAVAVLP